MAEAGRGACGAAGFAGGFATGFAGTGFAGVFAFAGAAGFAAETGATRFLTGPPKTTAAVQNSTAAAMKVLFMWNDNLV